MAQHIQSLPIGLCVLILATGAVGAVFVFAGHRLLGAALAILGAGLGGVVGAAVAELLLPSAPAWVVVTVFALVFALVGALSGRLAAAFGLAVILGVAGVLVVVSADRHGWIGFADRPASAPTSVAQPAPGASAPNDAAPPLTAGTTAALRQGVAARLESISAPLRTPAIEAQLGGVRSLVADGWSMLLVRWEGSPRPVRTLMLACGAMCGFLGLCLGLLAARWTAAFVTALLGAVLVILAVAAGTQQFLGDPATIPGQRTTWLIAWATLAMIGTAVQWRMSERPQKA